MRKVRLEQINAVESRKRKIVSGTMWQMGKRPIEKCLDFVRNATHTHTRKKATTTHNAVAVYGTFKAQATYKITSFIRQSTRFPIKTCCIWIISNLSSYYIYLSTQIVSRCVFFALLFFVFVANKKRKSLLRLSIHLLFWAISIFIRNYLI